MTWETLGFVLLGWGGLSLLFTFVWILVKEFEKE